MSICTWLIISTFRGTILLRSPAYGRTSIFFVVRAACSPLVMYSTATMVTAPWLTAARKPVLLAQSTMGTGSSSAIWTATAGPIFSSPMTRLPTICTRTKATAPLLMRASARAWPIAATAPNRGAWARRSAITTTMGTSISLSPTLKASTIPYTKIRAGDFFSTYPSYLALRRGALPRWDGARGFSTLTTTAIKTSLRPMATPIPKPTCPTPTAAMPSLTFSTKTWVTAPLPKYPNAPGRALP